MAEEELECERYIQLARDRDLAEVAVETDKAVATQQYVEYRRSKFLAFRELKLTHQYQMDSFMTLRQKELNEVSGRIIAIKLILNPLSPDYERDENVKGMLEIELRELSKQIETLQDLTKKGAEQLKSMQQSQILAFTATSKTQSQ